MSSTGCIIVSVVLFDDDGGVVNICFTGTCTVTLCNGFHTKYLTLIGLVSSMHMDTHATPTIDTDISCHVKAIKLI